MHCDQKFPAEIPSSRRWMTKNPFPVPAHSPSSGILPCTHRRTSRNQSCGSARTRPPGCGARFRNSVNCSWTRGPFCQHFFPTLRRLLRASRPPVGAAAAFSGGCPASVNRVRTTQAGELRNSRRTRFALDHFTFPVVPSPEISTK